MSERKKKTKSDLDDSSQWQCRPRRKIIKPCLDYSQVLLREEEQALKKALYVSLRDSKLGQDVAPQSSKKQCLKSKPLYRGEHSRKDGSEAGVPSQSLSKSSGTNVYPNIKKRKSLKPLELPSSQPKGSEVKRQRIIEAETRNSDSSLSPSSKLDSKNGGMFPEPLSCNEMVVQGNAIVGSLSKRSRRQLRAQRKFAHSQPCSPNSLFLQRMGKSSGWRPKTEDFIKFLCLRGSASLPEELEFFNNPGLPPSPLSSEEEEYLPVSPFFKRQVDCSGTMNQLQMYNSYRRQLECEFSEVSSSMDRSIKPQSPDLSSVCFETDNSQSASSINDNSNLPSTGSSDKKFFSGCSDGNKSKSFFENVTKVGVKNFPHSQSREFSKDKEKNAKLLSISDSHCVDTVKESKAFGKEQEKREQDVSVKEDYEHIGKAKTQDEIKMLDTGLLSLSYLSDSSQESEISKSRSNAHASIVKKPKKSKKAVWQGQSKAKLARPDANIFERELECAPTFRPMDQEFRDPMKYIRKMTPFILKYGICILVPPAGWQPSSTISDDIRFGTKVQHIHKMRKRDPETTKFLMYLHRCLGETSDLTDTIPQIGSCEVDLLRMSKVFENNGGVTKINTPRKWHKVADSLHIPKNAQGRVNKLQDIYYKYVLPFYILTNDEKEKIRNDVEALDNRGFLLQEPECKGRSASVSSFHRIASNAQEMYGKGQKGTCTLESDFWNIVTTGKRHVAAVSGDIDTINGESSPNVAKSKSGWNISSLPQVQGSLLRHLGVVPGLNTSSLKFSSIFSTSEWQKPYDGLFRIEYLHTGADRVWYAVPSFAETSFLNNAKALLPCTEPVEDEIRKFMISPLDLITDDCRISRAVQKEGQFVLCQPNVYYCVVSSGYCLTESCYLAQPDWLETRLDQDKFVPAKKFPAEMIILNYADHLVKKAKMIENTSLLMQLVETIKDDTSSLERKLASAGVEKAHEILPGRNKRVAVDWEVCCICGRPLYPLVIWKESRFYCADHAIQSFHNEDTADGYKMFQHWSNDQLSGLLGEMEKLNEDRN